MSPKTKLQEKCKTLVLNDYGDGGIASWNEYNQFLCDIIGDLIPHLSVEGLKHLKRKAQEVRDDMPDSDKW